MADESKDAAMPGTDELKSEPARVGFGKLLHAHGAIVLTTKERVVLGRKHKGEQEPDFHAVGVCPFCFFSVDFLGRFLCAGSSKNISRQHAELFVEDEKWFIQCVSKNGIDVNGTTIYNGACVFVGVLCGLCVCI